MAQKSKLNDTEIVDLYKTKGSVEIARLNGTCALTVRRVLIKNGICIRPRGGGKHNRWTKHGLAGKATAIGVAPETYYRAAAVMALGGKCARCGTSDLRVLEVNHINGKNKSYERKGGGKQRLMLRIANGEKVSHVNLLCANCNIIHEFDRGRRQGLLKAFAALRLIP
jgi:hypothetical protein